MLIAEEVNCIETAYLRLHLVPRETELRTSRPLSSVFRLTTRDLSQVAEYAS